MKADYFIKRGEDLRLTLTAIDGDVDTVVSAIAKMKKAGPNGTVPVATAPIVATLTTTAITLGWAFTLTDEQTALLDPGLYVVDAKLDLVNTGVRKTQSVLVEIKPSVT